MRTAHRVWSGVFALTFVVVAAAQCSGSSNGTSSAGANPSPPPFARTGVLATFTNPANLRLVDGRAIHVPMLNGVDSVNSPDGGCREQASDATVRAMLSGKTITLTAPPRTRDARSLVPAGYVEADVTVDGVDYASTFERQYAVAAFDRCTPAAPPVTYSEPSSSSDTDVYVDSDDDTNHRDGAATGGYCRKKWWC